MVPPRPPSPASLDEIFTGFAHRDLPLADLAAAHNLTRRQLLDIINSEAFQKLLDDSERAHALRLRHRLFDVIDRSIQALDQIQRNATNPADRRRAATAIVRLYTALCRPTKARADQPGPTPRTEAQTTPNGAAHAPRPSPPARAPAPDPKPTAASPTQHATTSPAVSPSRHGSTSSSACAAPRREHHSPITTSPHTTLSIPPSPSLLAAAAGSANSRPP